MSGILASRMLGHVVSIEFPKTRLASSLLLVKLLGVEESDYEVDDERN
jgi:hypothetical protein